MNRQALLLLKREEEVARAFDLFVDVKSYLLGVAVTLFKLNFLTAKEYVIYCEAVKRSNY